MTEKSTEKYGNWIYYTAAYLRREMLRARLKPLVRWSDPAPLEPGCTAVIGLCSKLPGILPANLSCLEAARWPDLRQVIIAVDTTERSFDAAFVREMTERFGSLNVKFVFYSDRQHEVAERLRLPYVYSWLSWVCALDAAKTRTVLLHDYDALLLGQAIAARHQKFETSAAKVQGVQWYWVNGIDRSDRIASTFETFVDLSFLRQHHPIEMFNKVGRLNGRRVDFDTLTFLQARKISPSERDIVPMEMDELAHPTQMIHQYTLSLKHPGHAWHCVALVMIPFFHYVSGDRAALVSAGYRMAESKGVVDLLGDGCIMNFAWLTQIDLERILRTMVQVCVSLRLPPDAALISYGDVFYDFLSTPIGARWKDGFEGDVEAWIARSIQPTGAEQTHRSGTG